MLIYAVIGLMGLLLDAGHWYVDSEIYGTLLGFYTVVTIGIDLIASI